MHWVNDNLFDHIEVRKTWELAVAGRVLLDEVLASGGGAELTIVLAELTMLLAGPARERYNKQADKWRSTYGPCDLPPSWNAATLALSWANTQQRVQKWLWEWDANPPILWAAGLSQTTATRMTRTKRPKIIITQSAVYEDERRTFRSGLCGDHDSVLP